ncbi:MAG TPA: metal-dependent hydrolase [Longimicrobiales bacterium]|nr:metal-dependent hydrolase [Longimicrobiales bacterium]
MPRLTWHGHACFSLRIDSGEHLLVDPYIEGNPAYHGSREDLDDVDWILVSHGHYDHFGDVIPLAKKTGATLIGTVEIVSFAKEQGVGKTHGMNIGGAHRFPFGRVKLTPALHGGQVEGDESGKYTTPPTGFLLELEGARIYYSGDTALTMDMQLLRDRVDLAILPIGDNFTMGPEDAAIAVDFIRPKQVIPVHYNTWPLIAQDPKEFARLVGKRAQTVILEPGGSWDF